MVEEPMNSTIDAIVRLLKDSQSILFITGAGISADSGVPTYRGIGGLYNVDLTEEGYPIEEALSASMLASNPALTWKYLAQIGRAVSGVTHNRAHEVIAEMEAHFSRVWTLTQNVDGFHTQAGAKNVIEAHGNMHSLSCVKCKASATMETFDEEMELPPKCPQCGGLVRPDVVLFGELLSGDGMATMQREVEHGFDVTFSIGTSSVFPYIQAPIEMARYLGNPTVEINPSETSMSSIVDYHVPMKAAAALEEIWSRYQLA